MSTPVPSFPSFSSFPELDAGPSSALKDQESENNNRHKPKRRNDKSSTRLRKEKESRRHHSKLEGNERDEPGSFAGRELVAALATSTFFSDHRGDMLNVTYGGLHSGDIPRYRLAFGGRHVLGLSNALTVISNTGKEVVIASRDRRKLPQLSDSKTRVLLETNKPRRFVSSDRAAARYEEIEGVIRFPTRTGNSEVQEYRSIEAPAENSDQESSSGGSVLLEDDMDTSPVNAREEHVKDLEARIQHDPDDESLWLQLLKNLQVESFSRVGIKARAEIAVSVISRAFKAHPNNTRSSTLRLKYLKAFENLYNDTLLAGAWEEALSQADCVDLRLEWLDWRLRRTVGDIGEALKDASQLFTHEWTGLSDDDIDKLNIRLLWRISVFLKQAGYTERAYALLQAEAQLLFRTDTVSRERPFAQQLDDLEEFWESEEQRIGDSSYSPRSSESIIAEPDPFIRWAVQEDKLDERCFNPLRTSDSDSEDPYSTILFSDIRPFLVNIRTTSGVKLFRLVWLSFTGLRIPGLLPALANTTSDSKWAEISLCGRHFLDDLFPKQTTHQMYAESIAGVTVGKERAYRSSFGNIREWACGLLEPLESIFLDGTVRMWERFDGDLEAARSIFKELYLGEGDEDWLILSLALELSVSAKGAIKLSRQLLSRNEHSFRLWAAHARLEIVRGKLAEARKIYETILQTTHIGLTVETAELWWDYADLQWVSGCEDDALDVILRSTGQRDGRNTIVVLRAKRHLEEHVAEVTNWRAKLRICKLRILLELLTGTLRSAIEVGRQHLSTVNRSGALHEGLTVGILVMVFHYTKTMRNYAAPRVLRELAQEAIQLYPDDTIVIGIFLESEKGEAVWGRVRRDLGDRGQPKSVVRRVFEVWVAGWDIGRWEGEIEGVRAALEDAVTSDNARGGSVLWRVYVEFEIRYGRREQAKMVLFRALGECPYCKELYLVAFGALRSAFERRELATLAETMVERGLRLRGAFEGLLDVREEGREGAETEETEDSDEIVSRANELRRLMPY